MQAAILIQERFSNPGKCISEGKLGEIRTSNHFWDLGWGIVIIIPIRRTKICFPLLYHPLQCVGEVGGSVSESRLIPVTKTILKSWLKRYFLSFLGTFNQKSCWREKFQNLHQSLVWMESKFHYHHQQLFILNPLSLREVSRDFSPILQYLWGGKLLSILIGLICRVGGNLEAIF